VRVQRFIVMNYVLLLWPSTAGQANIIDHMHGDLETLDGLNWTEQWMLASCLLCAVAPCVDATIYIIPLLWNIFLLYPTIYVCVSANACAVLFN